MSSAASSQSNQALGQAHSRRDFLWRSGGGLGGIALAGMLGRDGALRPQATRQPIGLHHAPKAKRVIQLFMGGRRVMSTCLISSRNYQAPRRKVGPWRDGRTVPKLPGQDIQVAVGMGATRPVRQAADLNRLGTGRVCRRHGVHSQRGWQNRRAQPGDLSAGHRISTARFSRHGRVGELRAGQPQRQPADVCRAAGPSRLRLQRPEELEFRFSAGIAPGHHTVPRPGQPDRGSSSTEGSFVTAKSEAAAQSLLAKFNREHAASREAIPGWTPASSRTNSPHACNSAHPRRWTSPTNRRTSSAFTGSTTTSGLGQEINEIEEIDYFSRTVPRRPATTRATGYGSSRFGPATTTDFRGAIGIHMRT